MARASVAGPGGEPINISSQTDSPTSWYSTSCITRAQSRMRWRLVQVLSPQPILPRDFSSPSRTFIKVVLPTPLAPVIPITPEAGSVSSSMRHSGAHRGWANWMSRILGPAWSKGPGGADRNSVRCSRRSPWSANQASGSCPSRSLVMSTVTWPVSSTMQRSMTPSR